MRKKIKTGADLRKFRQSLGMTQKQFAGRLGFTWVYVSYLENDKRKITETVRRLCRLIEMEMKS